MPEHPFAAGDRVVVAKDRCWRFLVKKNICVLRDGGKRAVWWPTSHWEPADCYRANVFADFLEESGYAEAAGLLREKFPISE